MPFTLLGCSANKHCDDLDYNCWYIFIILTVKTQNKCRQLRTEQTVQLDENAV